MKYVERGLYVHRGYTISRGDYIDTPDNRMDGWYVDSRDARITDRRGPGYATLREAQEAINEQCDWAAREGDQS